MSGASNGSFSRRLSCSRSLIATPDQTSGYPITAWSFQARYLRDRATSAAKGDQIRKFASSSPAPAIHSGMVTRPRSLRLIDRRPQAKLNADRSYASRSKIILGCLVFNPRHPPQIDGDNGGFRFGQALDTPAAGQVDRGYAGARALITPTFYRRSRWSRRSHMAASERRARHRRTSPCRGAARDDLRQGVHKRDWRLQWSACVRKHHSILPKANFPSLLADRLAAKPFLRSLLNGAPEPALVSARRCADQGRRKSSHRISSATLCSLVFILKTRLLPPMFGGYYRKRTSACPRIVFDHGGS